MSRIVLSRYESGQQRFVVGWDHPASGAFWQEFTEEPEDDEYPEDWEEIIRDGGMWPGIPMEHFLDSVPEDLRPLVTPTVMRLLYAHADDPDSGYNKQPIDLS